MARPSRQLAAGQLRRNVLLGTEAVYRICDWDRNLVQVEVVSVPGLLPGRRCKLTHEAVRAMDVVDDAKALDDSLERWTRATRVQSEGP